MRHLTALYLWKEWRDQRATLGWLAAAMFVIAGAGMLLGPSRPLTADPWLVVVVMGIAYLGVLLTVGTDLLSGEIARTRVRFLDRLPAGLGTAFRAKFLLYLACSFAAMAYGVLLLLLFTTIRTGAWPERLFSGTFLLRGVYVFGFSLWVFPVSVWVPRSTLALPATAIFGALLCWPVWLPSGIIAWYQPLDWHLPGLVALSYVGAPVTAWASFTIGLRFGRSSRQALGVGILIASLSVSPSWAWTAARIHDLRTVDPLAEDFRIGNCIVAEGERYAFLTAYRGDGFVVYPSHRLVVDLRSGDWRDDGLGAWYACREIRHDNLWFDNRVGTSQVWGCEAGRNVELYCRDALTGGSEEVEPGRADDCGIDLPSNMAAHDDLHPRRKRGLGYLVHVRQKGRPEVVGIYDPFRQKLYPVEEGDPGSARSDVDIFVRPGLWIVGNHWEEGYELMDPETGRRSPWVGMPEERRRPRIASDGRLYVLDNGRLLLVDPETGVREEVALPASLPAGLSKLGPRYETPRVLGAYGGEDGGDWRELLLHDIESGTVRRSSLTLGPEDSVVILGHSGPHSVFAVHNHNRLVRVYFDGRETEILFPRPEE